MKICNWQGSADGGLSFRSAEASGRIYHYQGIALRDTIRGRLEAQSTSNPRRYGVVTFRRVDSAGTPPTGLGLRAGIYSNVGYNEQAGDATGSELALVTTGGDPKISLTLVEDAFGPFLAADISQSRDTVYFRFAGYPSRWRAVFQDSVVALWDEAAVQRPNGAPTYSVRRAQRLAEFFAQEGDGPCAP